MADKRGGKRSQIDYIVGIKSDKKQVMNCKVISGEPVVSGHRLLVFVMNMRSRMKRQTVSMRREKIKLWSLTEEKLVLFKEELQRK